MNLTLLREILTPLVGALTGWLASKGLTLTPDQQLAAVTAGATALVAAERVIVRWLDRGRSGSIASQPNVTTVAGQPDPAKNPAPMQAAQPTPSPDPAKK